MKVKIKEIEKRFQICDTNFKKFRYRKPDFEFDYSFDSYWIEKELSPVPPMKEKTEDNRHTNSMNEDNELEDEISSRQLVLTVLKNIETNHEFKKKLPPLLEKISNFTNSYTTYSRSIFEYGPALQEAFGYHTKISVEEEEKIVKDLKEVNAYDLMKSYIGIEDSLYTSEDRQKMGAYMDSLSDNSYIPRKYLVDNYEMFYNGPFIGAEYDLLAGLKCPIPDELKRKPSVSDCRISDLTENEKHTFEPLQKSLNNWAKVLNIISSFHAIQNMLGDQEQKKKLEPEEFKKRLYWEAKIFEVPTMNFPGKDLNENTNDEYKIYFYLRNILFSGVSSAKITRNDLVISKVKCDENPEETHHLYELFVDIDIPLILIYLEYYIISNEDLKDENMRVPVEDIMNPGRLKISFEKTTLNFVFRAVRIDENCTDFIKTNCERLYFRNPQFKFKYDITRILYRDEVVPVNKDPMFDHTRVTKTVSNNAALATVKHFLTLVYHNKKNTMAIFYRNVFYNKFSESVIRMPTIYEFLRVMEFVFNNHPKRLMKYSNEEERKAMERKFFDIVSKKSKAVRFIENSLNDLRKNLSIQDQNALKALKESYLNDDNDSIEELVNIFEENHKLDPSV